MEWIGETISATKSFLWQGPLLLLLAGTGLYLTFKLRFLQVRGAWHAFRLVTSTTSDVEAGEGDISPFSALMTALAGAVGTGNITGIAVALSIGGIGSLFWMWVVAFLGTVTAFSESTLAVHFRTKNSNGEMCGGPMVTLDKGCGLPRLAKIFCILGILASFGIGATVQSNSVASGMLETLGIPPAITGLAMAALTAGVILGGIRWIGRAASILVPFMAVLYVAGGIVVCIYHYEALPTALLGIVRSAFSPSAAAGACGWWLCMEHGAANGVFANEAGLGSLAIAASSTNAKSPVTQGLFAIAGVYMATMGICTVTGLVLAVTGVLDQPAIPAAAKTIAAFRSVTPELGVVVVVGLVFFAFTTVLAWAYYGEKCMEYLVGVKATTAFRVFYCCLVPVGALTSATTIWDFANLANGLMAIPNLISILLMATVVRSLSERYFFR